MEGVRVEVVRDEAIEGEVEEEWCKFGEDIERVF